MHESKKSINKCLNCTIPVRFCTGKPKTCKSAYKKWQTGELQRERLKREKEREYTTLRTGIAPKCPYCSLTQGVMKHGYSGNKQRWYCKYCEKSYTESSWDVCKERAKKYRQAEKLYAEGNSTAQVARRMKISWNTAQKYINEWSRKI